MKNSIISNCIILLFIILYGNDIFCQITLAQDPTHFGQCPGALAYTYENLPSGCDTFTLQITSGKGTITAQNSIGFTLNAADSVQEITLRLTSTDLSCPAEKIFKIPVLSINAPDTITDCPPKLVVGKSHNFELTANMLFKYRGDTDPTEVDGYQWQIASGGTGWNLTALDEGLIFDKHAQIVTNSQHGAIIRARAVFNSQCSPAVSVWDTCEVERYAQDPCPIVGAPAYIVCGDVTDLGLLATVTAGLSGYTYHWTYPSGWSGPSSGPAVSYPSDQLHLGFSL